MKCIIDLLNALAPFAWPTLVLYIFSTSRPELKSLVARLRRGKILGQEIELFESLERLAVEVSAVSVDAASPEEGPNDKTPQEVSYRERILSEADISAFGAFLRVSSDLEVKLNEILARAGWQVDGRRVSVREGFSRIPPTWKDNKIIAAVDQFSVLRNRIVHEKQSVAEVDVRRAIDIALDLLDALNALPLEEVRVKDLVDVFSDSDLQYKFSGIRGLRVVRKYQDQLDMIAAYPTSKTWYEPGQLLTSEWDTNVQHAPAFYKDPDDGAVKQAWVAANEFIGRPIKQLSMN